MSAAEIAILELTGIPVAFPPLTSTGVPVKVGARNTPG